MFQCLDPSDSNYLDKSHDQDCHWLTGSDASHGSIFHVLNVMGVVSNCPLIVDLMFANSVICYASSSTNWLAIIKIGLSQSLLQRVKT